MEREYDAIEKEIMEEELNTDRQDNGLNANIPSLQQLCMKLVPNGVTARSLTGHYDNLNLSLRHPDASDDSSLSSEDEGIDVSIPVKYPQLSVKKIVRRMRRFDKRRKGTYRPRHYHTKQFPCAKKEAMMAEIERRKRLAEEARRYEL